MIDLLPVLSLPRKITKFHTCGQRGIGVYTQQIILAAHLSKSNIEMTIYTTEFAALILNSCGWPVGRRLPHGPLTIIQFTMKTN